MKSRAGSKWEESRCQGGGGGRKAGVWREQVEKSRGGGRWGKKGWGGRQRKAGERGKRGENRFGEKQGTGWREESASFRAGLSP